MQVHEKSILLSLVPSTVLMDEDPHFYLWYQILGLFSMFHLLKKDGLVIPYFAVIIAYTALVQLIYEDSKPKSKSFVNIFKSVFIGLSYLGKDFYL